MKTNTIKIIDQHIFCFHVLQSSKCSIFDCLEEPNQILINDQATSQSITFTFIFQWFLLKSDEGPIWTLFSQCSRPSSFYALESIQDNIWYTFFKLFLKFIFFVLIYAVKRRDSYVWPHNSSNLETEN